jgi:hypothetical protein
MVRKATTLMAVMAVTALTGAFAAPARDAGPALTVGEFSRSLVETLRASGTYSAEKTTRIRGAVVGREQAVLTEEAAVALLRAAGLEATTATPWRELGQVRAQALLRRVGGQADSLQGLAAAASVSVSSQGSIEPCLSLSNHGQCVECCKDQGVPANSCAKACFVINKPSPSEPLP